MALDLAEPLADRLGIAEAPDVRRAVAGLLLALVHDANGHLGAAVLRSASGRRSLGRLRDAIDEGHLEGAASLIDRASAAQAEVDAALGGVRTLLEALASAAWELEGDGRG